MDSLWNSEKHDKQPIKSYHNSIIFHVSFSCIKMFTIILKRFLWSLFRWLGLKKLYSLSIPKEYENRNTCKIKTFITYNHDYFGIFQVKKQFTIKVKLKNIDSQRQYHSYSEIFKISKFWLAAKIILFQKSV